MFYVLEKIISSQ